MSLGTQRGRVSNKDFNPGNMGNSFNAVHRLLNSGDPNVFNNTSNFNGSNMMIIYTNADVLTKVKLSELREIATRDNPEVIAVTEVFPKRSTFDTVISVYTIEGYDMFASGNEKGRGVLLYIKKELRASEVNFKTAYDDNLAHSSREYLRCDPIHACIRDDDRSQSAENQRDLHHFTFTKCRQFW